MAHHDVFLFIFQPFPKRGQGAWILHLTQDICELMTEQRALGCKGAAKGVDGSIRPVIAQSKDRPNQLKHPCLLVEEHFAVLSR